MDKERILITTEEAAKLLGITRQGVAYLVAHGKLRPAANIKSRFKFFYEEEVYRYLGER